MKILITNDDGIHAKGLEILVNAAKHFGEIFVVAPETEQSGKSHSINVRKGLTVIDYKTEKFEGIQSFSISSTPADCVRFAHHHLKEDFDLVLSGVNRGYNMGEDIMYSGTVAGASEAAFIGKKGIAFSTIYNDFSSAEKHLIDILRWVLDNNILHLGNLYNINIPPLTNEKVEYMFTFQGSTHYDTRFDFEENAYFQRGKPHHYKQQDNINSDVYAIIHNKVSIMPLTVDRTDRVALEKLIKNKD